MLRFPDAETVMQDLVDPVASAYKFLPDDLERQITRSPVALIERVGGTNDGVTDRAELQVSVWAKDRPTAWRAMSEIGDRVDSLTWGGTVSGVWVDTSARVTTDQQIFTGDPDERRVIATFRLDFRRQ